MLESSILDWSEFQFKRPNGSTAFDGEKFEDLVRELLQCHFDGIWFGTLRSWDGGKDFVDLSIKGEKRWAECKMYHQALSLKAISNTLVMAVSDREVRQLLIFSYSRLNNQTKNHLSAFSASTTIAIQSFDGLLLEQYVLKTPTVLERFFRNHKLVRYPVSLSGRSSMDVEVSSFFSANPQIDEQQLTYRENPTHLYKISLWSPCVYQIIVKSISIDKCRLLKFDFSELIKPTSYIRVLNERKLQLNEGIMSLDLLPGQISGMKLYLSFNRTGNIEIPTVPVYIDDGPELESILPKAVSVGFLTRPALIGSLILNACKEVERHVSSQHTNLIVAVTGISGVGKSRFLEEIQTRLLEESYEIRGLDGASSACRGANMFIRMLLARLWRLPDPLGSNQMSGRAFAMQADASIYDQVCALIYGDSLSAPISDSLLQHIVNIVCQAFQRRRNALLIDNVQALDNFSIQLLKKVSSSLQGKIGSACLVFAFNEQELLFSESALYFQQALKDQNTTTPETVHYVELAEFDPNQVKLFLNQLIRSQDGDNDTSFTNRHPSLTSLILEHVLPRPLDLFQLMKAAEDQEIVKVEYDCFCIIQLDAFHDLIRSLQKTTASILEKRWQSLEKNQSAVRILLLVSLVGDITESLLESTGCDEATLQFLVQAGFLKAMPSDGYHYYHQSIERHFSLKLLLKADRKVRFAAAQLQNRLEEKKLDLPTPLASLQLAHLVRQVSRTILLHAMTQISDLSAVPVDTRIEIAAKILESYLDVHLGFITIPDYLPSLDSICRFMSGRHQGDLAQVLLKYSNILMKFRPNSSEELRQQFWIIRQAGSYARFSNSSVDGLHILDQGLKHLRLLRKTVNTKARARVAADLYDRKCVHQKSIGHMDEAVRSGRKAARICNLFSILDVLCLTLIDLGYIYYGSYQKRENLLYYWKQAVALFEEQTQAVTERNSGMVYACLLIQAIITSLNSNNEEAIAILDNMIRRAHNNGVSYYETQGLLVKAIVIFRHAYQNKRGSVDKKTLQRIEIIVAMAEDLSLTFGMKNFLPCCHFITAELKASQGRTKEAVSRFKMTIKFILDLYDKNAHIVMNKDLAIIERAHTYIATETGMNYTLPLKVEESLCQFREIPKKKNFPVTSLGVKGLELPCP